MWRFTSQADYPYTDAGNAQYRQSVMHPTHSSTRTRHDSLPPIYAPNPPVSPITRHSHPHKTNSQSRHHYHHHHSTAESTPFAGHKSLPPREPSVARHSRSRSDDLATNIYAPAPSSTASHSSHHHRQRRVSLPVPIPRPTHRSDCPGVARSDPTSRLAVGRSSFKSAYGSERPDARHVHFLEPGSSRRDEKGRRSSENRRR